ncbi:MAG TPA: four-carbon acid sugar kinase family protein, partial [Roseiflexaceae bacterium]|nr:four-carbon acid sugar kinase family protein [Roseiflexaceae bacterium]
MALAILADDLTGAADCAARCRGAGLPAEIALRLPRLSFGPGVTAFTSDSRHLPPTQAATRVHELVAGLRNSGDVSWYKKIDSTLRGNLGAELDATLDALGRGCALVCPAFPAQGRGLSGGNLISSVAQPIHLPSLLAEQSRRPVAAIALADV